MEGENDVPKSGRLLSLDALRGFDMFWITGGQKIIYALATLTGWPVFKWIHLQMHHVDWEGFAFYDLIFPLFLFLAGVSMPFSFGKRLERGDSKASIYRHAFKRMLLLVILGMLYNRILNLDAEHLRFASVLGRIGIAWFFAVVIFLNANLRWQIVWFWGLLIFYYLIMQFVPVPGFGAGNYTLEGSLAGYIDRLFLPGKLHLEVLEPEGILSTIPAISTALMGVFAGITLRSEIGTLSKLKKGLILILSGIVFLVFGKTWGSFFPIIKNIWTSSFTLYAGGWSLLFLGIFYLIIDVWGFKKWSYFFIVIGLNSITIYLVQYKIIDFNSTRDFFFGGIVQLVPESIAPLIGAIGYVACVWTFLYFLYRYKIFLKV
ncbi:MAG: acyltransferase family protein [Draconibacterium sp.]